MDKHMRGPQRFARNDAHARILLTSRRRAGIIMRVSAGAFVRRNIWSEVFACAHWAHWWARTLTFLLSSPISLVVCKSSSLMLAEHGSRYLPSVRVLLLFFVLRSVSDGPLKHATTHKRQLQ